MQKWLGRKKQTSKIVRIEQKLIRITGEIIRILGEIIRIDKNDQNHRWIVQNEEKWSGASKKYKSSKKTSKKKGIKNGKIITKKRTIRHSTMTRRTSQRPGAHNDQKQANHRKIRKYIIILKLYISINSKNDTIYSTIANILRKRAGFIPGVPAASNEWLRHLQHRAKFTTVQYHNINNK